ncbi:MAG TPA: D-aminoacylase [Candidatus Limnocylindria bacterium]|nr:D-aminoacylase [Candidatus Limnocylindria bacterium]
MAGLVLRGGTIHDGLGGEPYTGDVAIEGDRISAVGRVPDRGAVEIDARGLAVAPGFVNMLSHAWASLIEDGRSQSDIRQGVTLEVFGEVSMGPLNDEMKRDRRERQGDVKFDIVWTTLGEYLDHLVSLGVSCNVASFVSATTVRVHELGSDDRRPSADELARMRALVDAAMREGALGVASALIYAPATFADTDELVALAEAAARHGGMYISHMRSEGDRFLEAVDELVTIARRAGARAEIYHLKQAGRDNWGKLDAAVLRIEAARREGLGVTADMYPYTAGATGLDASLPPWVQDGGHRAFMARLRDGAVRARLIREMRRPGVGWENMLHLAGSAERVLLSAFTSETLKRHTGMTLAQVAAERGTAPEETILDLVLEDDSRVGAIYFVMSEENVRRQVALPWVSFASDSASLAPEGVFLRSTPHPRAYGCFARVLAKYVRDERALPLAEAVRRLTSLPAETLRIPGRGRLAPGYFADVVAFDPASVQDHATYAEPHRYATGMEHVVVNGVRVLSHGEHTGARPGRVVRGPGWRPG